MKEETGMTYKEMFHFGFSNLDQKIDKLADLMQDNNNKIATELKEVNHSVANELKEINQHLATQNGNILKLKIKQDNCPIDEVKDFLIRAILRLLTSIDNRTLPINFRP